MQVSLPSQQIIELISSTYGIDGEEALRRWIYAQQTALVFGYENDWQFIASILEQLNTQPQQQSDLMQTILTSSAHHRTALQKWKDKLRRRKYKLLHPPKHKHHTAFHKWHASLKRKATKFYQPKHTLGGSAIQILSFALNNHD